MELAGSKGEVDRVYRTSKIWILQGEFHAGDFVADPAPLRQQPYAGP